MKKKFLAVSMAVVVVLGMALATGCGQSGAPDAAASAAGEAGAAVSAAEEAGAAAEDAAVAEVNGLIEAIQVQEWTETTEADCAAAKAAYDALSDEQKEMLDDPDYFGLDTGDASADDPLNQDEIGENELLVVSFGTSFNESRATDIGGVEKALAEAYPDWSVRRAFTAQIIINHVLARDGESIDNVDQALQRAIANGVKNLVIQPTHLMHGAEYDELAEAVAAVEDQFESVKIAEPLLGEVGADISEINADKEAAAKAMVAEAAKVAGADSIDALAEDGTAIVFMGHGTSHEASITYDQMSTQMAELGYDNVFVGTVEGNPADTALPEVKKAVEAAGYTKVILRPMMVVAGDHANNDMAADEEGSWYYGFVNGGEFEVEGADEAVDIGAGFGADNVTTQIEGLGRIPAIEEIYVAHTGAVIE
ncbi:MAG: sirohydrochlorin cobaltochelatase [Eubacterium sp.]|nr:sirohydrochlorin cobaltochelatase [Eubacterium sp.]